MIHLLFEQSGTFRDEFRALGYEAQDYDIQKRIWSHRYYLRPIRGDTKIIRGKCKRFGQNRGGANWFLLSFLARSLKRKKR